MFVYYSSWASAANIETLITATEASKVSLFYKIQGEINLVRINKTVEPRYNEHEHELYQIHRYRTLVSDHKSTLCQLFCSLALLISSCCFFKKKIWLHEDRQCRSSPMGRGAPPPRTFSFRKKKCNFFCNFHVIQKSLDELICLEILPKVWPKFLTFSWKVLYILDFWINCICMFFVTNISCLLPFISGKLLKNPKNIKDFEIRESVFSGHVEIIILKYSPASATKVRLPGKGGREGRGGEGKGRDGVFLSPPPLQNVLWQLHTRPFNFKFHRSHVLSWTADGRDTDHKSLSTLLLASHFTGNRPLAAWTIVQNHYHYYAPF